METKLEVCLLHGKLRRAHGFVQLVLKGHELEAVLNVTEYVIVACDQCAVQGVLFTEDNGG